MSIQKNKTNIPLIIQLLDSKEVEKKSENITNRMSYTKFKILINKSNTNKQISRIFK
jgi:hypothetical protein